MAPAIPFIMLAGAAISAMGAVSQANAAQAASGYNATLKAQHAKVALDQASVDAWRVQQQGQFAHGSLIAGLGASGGTSDDAIDLLRMSVSNAKLDEETVLYKGRLRATGYYNEAELDRLAGRTAEEQGYLQGASSLLTGIGQTGYTYASARRGPIRSSGSRTYDSYGS